MSHECEKCGEQDLECNCTINDYECHHISKMAHQLLKERDSIIDLFCKTFFVSQEPRSLEELRALFEICELEITQHSDMKQTFRIKLKSYDEPRY
jgi:hypothetical protein